MYIVQKDTVNLLSTLARQQIAIVMKIAQEQQLDLNDFDLITYGAAKFQKFIETLEQKIGHAAAIMTAFYIIDGAQDWLTVANGLDMLEFSRLNCEIAIANSRGVNKTRADIVFEVLNGLNGRDPLFSKPDKNNRTQMGLFTRILNGATWDNNGQYSLADCKPLTMLFYLTMSALGEETEIYSMEWYNAEDDILSRHMHSRMGDHNYENTHEKYDERNTIIKNTYAPVKIDNIWTILAEELVGKIKETKGYNVQYYVDILNKDEQQKTADEKQVAISSLTDEIVKAVEKEIDLLQTLLEWAPKNAAILNMLFDRQAILIRKLAYELRQQYEKFGVYDQDSSNEYVKQVKNTKNVLVQYLETIINNYNLIPETEANLKARVRNKLSDFDQKRKIDFMLEFCLDDAELKRFQDTLNDYN